MRSYFFGLKTPAFLSVSAKTGTVELTGLEMTRIKASGHALAIDWARVAQMPAFIYVTSLRTMSLVSLGIQVILTF